MNNFQRLITPEMAKRGGDSRSLAAIRELACVPDSMCLVCGMQKAWRYAGFGLCFTCTTGETDASKDYELVQRPARVPLAYLMSSSAPPAKGSDGWMEEQGFHWETFEENYPRWRHTGTGLTVRRLPEWTNEQWTEHKVEIAEKARRAPESRRRPRRESASPRSRVARAQTCAVAC
jgi:hypothetical protein